MKQYDRVKATFTPVRTDDLKPEAVAAVGTTGWFTAGWIVESEDGGSYVGQWAMLPAHESWQQGLFHGIGWVPLCDLTILVDEDGGVARLPATVGPDLVQDDPAARPKAVASEGVTLTETIVYQRVLSAEERRRVEDYVLGKYGIDREEKGGEHESVHGYSEVTGGVRDEDPGRSGR
jgi:hypothetical protein